MITNCSRKILHKGINEVEDYRNMQMWMLVLVWRRVSPFIVQKICEETLCRIPDSKNLHEMSDEEGRLPQVSAHIYH
jgi:hypothetical protein